jgi:hypothetical protein
MSSLKEIVDHAIERAGGRIAVSKHLGVPASDLSLWCNKNHTRFIPIDHLMDLDAAAGDLFLKYWARQRGYDLVGRDTGREAAANVFRVIGELSRASGACAGVALEALADHDFTPTEKSVVHGHLRPVKDSIDELERFLAS